MMVAMNVAALNDAEQRVRFTIMQHLADSGRAPSVEDLATELESSPHLVANALYRLEDAHAIALAPASTNVWMAHPFSAIPTPFPVETARIRYWANCAWDSFGIPAVLNVDSTTNTLCPDCGEELTVRIRGGELESNDTVVHFAVRPLQFWDNVGFT